MKEKNSSTSNILKTFLHQYICVSYYSSSRALLEAAGVQYSKELDQDIIEFKAKGKKHVFHAKLSTVLKKEKLLKKLHPFEVALMQLLFHEHKLRHMLEEFRVKMTFPLIENFRLINRQFYSIKNKQEMLIISLPNSQQQLCLSARELLNQTHLVREICEANSSGDIQGNITLDLACAK